MTKLFKCEKCFREFSRKQHLIQHYNRKIPCINPPNQIIFYKDIPGNILPDTICNGNIIVKKILPTELLQDDLPKNRTEKLPELKAPITEHIVEPIKDLNNNSIPKEITKPKSTLCSKTNKCHTKTVKLRSNFQSENLLKAMEQMNEYDELYKRVKKYFQSEQVKSWLLEENEPDPINSNISLVELRRWYKDFRTAIDIEYLKLKI